MDATVDVVDRNLFAWLDAMREIAGSTWGEAPGGGRWVRTGLPSPIHNAIYATRLDADVDAAIERALDPFREPRTTLFWWTGTSSTAPEDLGARLVAHGLVPLGEGWPGMALDLGGATAGPRPREGVEIESVTDEASMRRWVEAFVEAYEVPAWAGESWYLAGERLGFDAMPWRMYTGMLDGSPVATAMLTPGAEVAGVQGVATAARARRRGIASAIMRVLFADARTMGFDRCVLSATEDGEQLYRALGFEATGASVGRYAWALDAAGAMALPGG